MSELHDSIDRKFTESLGVSGWEIMTDTGWEDVSHFHTTIDYEVWVLQLEGGYTIECADTHIVFDYSMREVFVKDLSFGDYVMTESGPRMVLSCFTTGVSEEMFDISVDSPNHRFYGNGILSHNTSAATVIILHFALFNKNKDIAILANKGSQAREILSRIQMAYEYLPEFLKGGVKQWNKGSVEFENGSKIVAAASSSTAIRGNSKAMVCIDETGLS